MPSVREPDVDDKNMLFIIAVNMTLLLDDRLMNLQDDKNANGMWIARDIISTQKCIKNKQFWLPEVVAKPQNVYGAYLHSPTY